MELQAETEVKSGVKGMYKLNNKPKPSYKLKWTGKERRRAKKEVKRKEVEALYQATLEYKRANKARSSKIDTYGELCPRCGLITQVKKHAEITQKHLNQPFYYSQWFYCVNPKCKTTFIMPNRFKVFPETDFILDMNKTEPDLVISVFNELNMNELNIPKYEVNEGVGKPPWE